MQSKTAMIAMSGGVDSSVAAYLCKEQGYSCIGATMKLYGSEEQLTNQISDAAAVAKRLDMPFYAFDCANDFEKKVIDDFISCYEQGLTPNPCVTCNRCLKFGTFLRHAEEMGCDYIVTGHYAKITQNGETGRYLLKKAATAEKDQSYFLAQLDQNQLSHTLFPLGELTKPEVRQIAEEQGFINARRKDSQDICFVPDGDYVAFIRRHTGKTYPQGQYLDTAGNVVGTHQGAISYTLGQRKGLGIALGQPMYVCAKDMAKNTVTVGTNEELFHTTLRANYWNWIAIPDLAAPLRVFAKARSRMMEQPATVYPEENGFARVVFDEPQRAITPGQAIVLYDGDTVIGGGTITEVI